MNKVLTYFCLDQWETHVKYMTYNVFLTNNDKGKDSQWSFIVPSFLTDTLAAGHGVCLV